MPEIIDSQPISCVALVILINWLATAVSTVLTPLISITNTLARVSEIRIKVLFMMSCVREESMMPTSGNSRIPSQIGVTGVDISIKDLLCARIFSRCMRAISSRDR